MKKKLLIFYDHFYPSFKAGGPTQSLVNLVREMYEQFDISIVCKPNEMGERQPMQGVVVNQWINWELKASVFYWQYGFAKKDELKKILSSVDPDVIYVNGIYSLYFNLLPLWYGVKYKKEKNNLSVILSARGMLHAGALSQKSLKKKLFLKLFRFFKLHEAVKWHATDAKEADFIRFNMGNQIVIKQAANFPNLLPLTPGPLKKKGQLVLGTIALISPMKNHLEILKALTSINFSVTWHIFGPVKDIDYWKACLAQIKKLPELIEVKYHGELAPHLLKQAMTQFQVFIMPSKSENFGHAIVEAMSAGKPVITTTATPFTDLENAGCGFAIDPVALQEGLVKSIRFFAEMHQEQYEKSCHGAEKYIHTKMDPEQLKKIYNLLFEDK